MVGISIGNEVNMKDKAIGICFRRKDQLSTDVILIVWQKVTQSNSRFNALDKLFHEVHSVKMPVGFGRRIKIKGIPLDTLTHLKSSILKVKAETDCLAHALVIAIAKITNDPNYKSYRDGWKIGSVVQRLLETTGIDLNRGGSIRELAQFQQYFKDYRIVVFSGLNCEDIMFDGQVQTEKRINLLYDEVARHYRVIVNITGAMAIRYVCKACNKRCCRDVTHKCEQTCSDCMSVPPCTFSYVRIPCESCNRTFRSRVCFDKHKNNKLRGKTVCEQKKNCAACGSLLTNKKHECNKPYCANSKRDRTYLLHGYVKKRITSQR